MASREVKVAILGDSASFDKAFKTAAGSADNLDKKLATTSEKLKAFGESAQTIGKQMSLAITLPIAAIAGAGFAELADSQKAMAQTAAVLKSTGEAANVTAKQVTGLASSLSEMSGVDDQVVQGGENILLTFTKVRNEVGKGNDIFTRGTKVILDMSVALGEDMQSAAIQVGKALNDPITGMTALRRVGVSFTQQQLDQVKAMVAVGDTLGAQKLILHELTVEFGGSAKAFGETLPGQLAKAKNAFDQMSASMLLLAAPAIGAVTAALTSFFGWVQNLPGPVKAVVDVLASLAAVAGPVIYLFGTIAKSIAAIQTAFPTLAAGIGTATGKFSELIAVATPWVAVAGLAIGAAVGLHQAFTNANGDLTIYTHNLTKLTDAQLTHAASVIQAQGDYSELKTAVRSLADESETTARKLVASADLTKAQRKELIGVIDQEVAANARSVTAQNGAASAYDDTTDSIKEQVDWTDILVGKINDHVNASLSSQGAAVSMDKAIQNLNVTLFTAGTNTLEARDAIVQTEQAVVSFGQKIYDEQLALGDSNSALAAQVSALGSVRDSLAPGSPLRAFLDQYISQLQHDIPGQVYTDFILRLSNETGLSVQDLRSLRDISNVYSFAEGGSVPGPVGAPHMAVVHGGEFVVPAAQAAAFRTPGGVTPVRTVASASTSAGDGGGGAIVIQIPLNGRIIAEATVSELNRAGGPKVSARAVV